MFLWRQEDTSSLRLFSVDSSGRQMIRNFSLRQRLHLLLELLYGECDERMRQEIKCSMLLSLRIQMCLLSSVEFLRLVWRNALISHLQSRILHCNTFTGGATTRQSPLRTFPPASTNDCHPYHLTKHPLTKPPLHTRKHSTKVDTTTHYNTNQPKQANGKTDNAVTSSGTTLLLARTPAPTSDTNSSP